jgi:hypothetical protein
MKYRAKVVRPDGSVQFSKWFDYTMEACVTYYKSLCLIPYQSITMELK